MLNDNNSYYKAYSILSLALKENKIEDGIKKSLNIIKMYFEATHVVIHKANPNDDYEQLFTESPFDNQYTLITSIIDIVKYMIQNNKNYFLNVNIKDIKNMIFIPIKLDTARYIITLTNLQGNNKQDELFEHLLIETMTLLLSKYEMIKHLKKDSEIDVLTGINNRKAYENEITENRLNSETVYGLFDLFRLKNINDNYSHLHGDNYIRQTAQILKKYFSNNIYRIGGDEFALISNLEKYENILIKIKVIQEEVRNIELNISEPLGINFGLVVRKNNESINELYQQADKLLSQDKIETYKKLGLKRRN